MKKHIKIGILRETKNPPDRRVAMTPQQAKKLQKKIPSFDIYVQSSDYRCFKDSEYKELNIPVVDDVSFCDVLVGVKEVAIEKLIPNKTYFFFSHTTKKQPYNRKLLQEVLQKNITLIDYEHLVNKGGKRLIAFSRWAGIIGCYNGLIAFGKRHKLFDLEPANQLNGIMNMFAELDKITLPPIKIAVTGHGRAGKGAVEVLNYLMVTKVAPSKFVSEKFNHPVYTVLDPKKYVKKIDESSFTLDEFFEKPGSFKSNFKKYSNVIDLLVTCHFWHPDSPVLFTEEEMLEENFNISVIADVTCDIKGSVPSTIRPSNISDPVYGYCPKTKSEVEPYEGSAVTVMAVDNLPGELPRDASEEFSSKMVKKILPLLLNDEESEIISRATITSESNLTEKYFYLNDYVQGD